MKSISIWLVLCVAVGAAADPIKDVSACPAKPIVLVNTGGRTANRLWEYITLYSIAKVLPNHQPYSMNGTNNALLPIFDNVSLPIIEDVPKYCDRVKNLVYKDYNTNVWSFIPLDKAQDKFKNVTGNIILQNCVILIEPMVTNIKEIKRVLPYKQKLIDEAQRSLWGIKHEYFSRTGVDNVTFVGVHIRRTDYLAFLPLSNMTGVGVEYFKFAINYFRSSIDKLGNPVFVVTSDDNKWAVDNLESDDVFITGGDTDNPGHDLVLLSLCNHSIFDYGTYGLWAALYTEGEVITVWQGHNQQNRVLRFNPKWHFVDPKAKPSEYKFKTSFIT